MIYRIKIKRRDGSMLTKETRDQRVIRGYAQTAKQYGDKIISIDEKNSNGSWRPAKQLMNLVVAGVTVGIGLGLLGAFAGAFSN